MEERLRLFKLAMKAYCKGAYDLYLKIMKNLTNDN